MNGVVIGVLNKLTQIRRNSWHVKVLFDIDGSTMKVATLNVRLVKMVPCHCKGTLCAEIGMFATGKKQCDWELFNYSFSW